MHLLQSPQWANFKTQFGWLRQEIHLSASAEPVQLLYRKLPLGFRFAYIPKGPTLNWADETTASAALLQLITEARQRGVIFLKVEPDYPANEALRTLFHQAGFVNGRPVQPPGTIIVDIGATEAEILAAMKSKTRYNIRLAQRKGVTVKPGTAADLPAFHQLSRITAQRDGFAVHPLSYYQAVYSAFNNTQRAVFLAEFEEQLIGGLMAFAWNGTAYYLYGASSNEHRNVMAPYLLQWEAIRWAKSQNCQRYDLWGIPNEAPEALEAQFANRNDGLWGVYRFKRGFGGRIVQSAGAFDFVYNKPLYALFSSLLKRRAG